MPIGFVLGRLIYGPRSASTRMRRNTWERLLGCLALGRLIHDARRWFLGQPLVHDGLEGGKETATPAPPVGGPAAAVQCPPGVTSWMHFSRSRQAVLAGRAPHHR